MSHGPKPKAAAERFWNNVVKGSFTECWLWKGYVHPLGYGKIMVKPHPSSPTNRQMFAHRLSWILHNGDIPDGLFVLHKCDNKICMNPAHLFLGTTADNVADRVAKCRTAHGESSGKTYLTKLQVLTVRSLYESGMRQCEIVRQLGINKLMVSRIVRRVTWIYT